jgi:hypothetical protein
MMWGPFVAWVLSAQQPAAVERCTVRVSAKGVSVDGDLMSRDQAIAKCKRTSGALVNIADDAQPTAWPALRRELERAHVKVYMRGVVDDRICLDNPLAKGCQ